jgi:uncharacterized protein YcbK (DUF882 family)
VSVLRKGREAAVSTFFHRAGLAAIVLVAGVMGGTRGTQDAVANGDTRSLTLYHNHTKETATITFRRNGQYDPRGLEQLNWMLRDWRRDEPTQMDPRLFDTLWEVYRQTGSSEPIHVNSAYRSPHTNAMLRRRSSAVAKSSQHMRGKAMDFYLPDVPIEKVRAIGMRLQNGGVGFYPNAYTPFVHLDVGSVRAWPRMTRDQLARIFPDGKTVHIPADGTPLEGYEAARAEVLARGFSVGGATMVAEAGEGSAAPKRKSFWATLFGGGDEDEDAEEVRTSTARNTYVPRRAPPAHLYNDSNSSVYAALQPVESAPARPTIRPAPLPAPEEPVRASLPVRQDAPAAPLPPPTRIAGLPTTVDTPTGPKLVWQQGATAQTSPVLPEGSNFDMLKQMALAPLPPRRPDDVVVTGTLAFAPMPPARPGAIAATTLLAGMGVPEARGPVAGMALLAGEPTKHPLPPPRPAARPVAVASLGAIPMVPAMPAAGPGTAKATPREPQIGDRTQIRSLFSDPGPASTGTPGPKGRPAAPSSALSAPYATLASGFSARPAADLATNRFTGSAVKPLPVR